MKLTPSEALREKAKKYEMLATLLEDSEMVSVAREILSAPHNGVTKPVTSPSSSGSSSKPKRGELEDAVIEALNSCLSSVDARFLAEKMESEGYPFGAKDHVIAVSKVLYRLAQNKKIATQKIGRSVAYSPLRTAAREVA